MLKYLSDYVLFFSAVVFLNSCYHSDDPRILIQKANIEIVNKNYDLAFKYLESVIEQDSNFAEAYYLRGLVQDIQGKDKSLVCNDLQKSVSLGFEKAKQTYNQYCIDLPYDKYKKLLSEFDEYILKFPDKFEGYYDRANLNFDYGLYEIAIDDYNKVISIKEYPVAFYNRGLCYFKLGQEENACKDIRKAIELGYEKAKEALYLCE